MMRNLLDRLMNAPHWIFRVTFFLLSFSYLFLEYDDVLYRLFWNGFFATNELYVHDVMCHTGGALRYFSQFVNQALISPFCGALLVSALLTAIAYLMGKSFRLRDALFVVSFLPSILLLSLYSSIGYDIYRISDTSFFISLILGMLSALSLYWAYVSANERLFMRLLVAVLAAALYPVIGIFSSVVLLTMFLHSLFSRHGVLSVSLVAFLALAPISCDLFVAGNSLPKGLFAVLNSLELHQTLFVCLLVVLSLPLARVLTLWNGGWTSKPEWFDIAFFCLLFLALPATSFKDENFYAELRLSRLCDKQEWEEMLRKCKTVEEPTRTINAYRVMALTYTDCLSDRLFKMKYPFVKGGFEKENFLFEEDLFYYAGFFNSSYRVSMETWQIYGLSYRRLRNLFFCSLMNGEIPLAERYLRQLEQSPVMSTFVEKGKTYLSDPQLMLRDYPSWKKTVDLIPNEDVLLLGDASLSRYYLCYSNLPPNCYEYRVMSDLWERHLKAFSYDLPYSVSAFKTIPDCVKEAAVLAVAMYGANPTLLDVAQVDEQTKNRVDSFFSELRSCSKKNAQKKLWSAYGKTYCYYFVFKDMPDDPKDK